MSINWAVAATALNRLKVALGANAITPSSGQSLDAAGTGQLVVGTSALSGATGVLATITLQNPSFSFSGRTATLLGVTLSATASATGTAALAELRDHSGTTIISGLTVGTSGTDFIIDNASIVSGNTVNCTSGTITG